MRVYLVCHKDYKTITCAMLKLKYKVAIVYKILKTYNDSVMLATH